jgi:hypothetical protein
MKKLAVAFACLALAATPVLACPHSDEAKKDHAPQTAEKNKDTKDAKGQEKAKAQPKAKQDDKTAKPKVTPKDDKVSKR